MNLTELRIMIEQHPDRGDLPVELVMAICMKESSCFEGHFYKHEKGYKWLVGSPDGAERIGQMSSWGPMQVMGAVARELGHTGPFTDLFEWKIGVKYGMLQLRRLRKRYEKWSDVIASYNAGHPMTTNGKYRNQDYVDYVLRRWNEYEHQIPLKSTEV